MIEEEIEQRSRGFVLVLLARCLSRHIAVALARSLEAPSHTPTRPRPPAVLLVITLTLFSSLFVVGGCLAAVGEPC